jgi:hypothetical protein
MTRRGPHARASARRGAARRAEGATGPFAGADVVRAVTKQGFRREAGGSAELVAYVHDDGRVVLVQEALPACIHPGDRVFNLLAHDLAVSSSALLRMLQLASDGRR